MLFDRVLEDSLGFIRRMLWSKKGDNSTTKPFQPTQSIPGEFGIIHLLDGRDTPRAVRTWMYSPKRVLNSAQMVASSVPMDLHIYVDFLGPLETNTTPSAKQEREAIAKQRQQGLSVPSHRLHLLKASHFLNKDGFYNYDIAFWQDVDLYPPNSGLSQKVLNKAAILFTDALAFKCLEIASPLKYKPEDWEPVVEEIRAQTLAKLVNR